MCVQDVVEIGDVHPDDLVPVRIEGMAVVGQTRRIAVAAMADEHATELATAFCYENKLFRHVPSLCRKRCYFDRNCNRLAFADSIP